MTREALIALQALAEALPVGQAVPVPREWLLELLVGMPVEDAAGHAPAVDLTCHQVADALGRDASTVRAWAARGEFPGAYRLNGREWRIPAESLRAWQEGQRQRPSKSAASIRPGGRRLALSSWRSTPAESSRWAESLSQSPSIACSGLPYLQLLTVWRGALILEHA